MLGEHLEKMGWNVTPRPVPGHEVRRWCARTAHGTHCGDHRREPLRDGRQHAVVSGAGTVDLVDEDQRRDAEPLQRAHQDTGLRLHALDRGDHQHRAVEHAQGAFHLGDEVRVPGGVDQVDGDVADRERHHRGLDRDPALPLQRERVGLRRASVDAADLVDDTGGEQQPLGEGGLTGVYMRQDPQVQRSASQAPYPPTRSGSPFRWIRALLPCSLPGRRLVLNVNDGPLARRRQPNFQAGNSAGRPNPAKSAAANEPSQPGCASSSTVRKARIAVIRSPSNVSTSMAAARYRPRAGSSM